MPKKDKEFLKTLVKEYARASKALREISALQYTTVGNVYAATNIADRALREIGT